MTIQNTDALENIRPILEKAVAALATVVGVKAIVLGGSRAHGTATAASDIDIGIYYASEAQLDMAALQRAAQQLDDDHRADLVAAPGGWGKWVNGGGWLSVDGQRLDLILRDLERVKQVIKETEAGIVSAHYQPGHPHAYINVMYRGELAVSKLLWDKSGEVATLKATAEIYPLRMKEALIGTFGFEAGFSGMLATTYAEVDDLFYVMAHITRAIACLNQVLFAINAKYCLNEKKAVRMIESFVYRPDQYKRKVDAILTVAGATPVIACAMLAELVDEVNTLLPNA
jgi:predicted nucleotidyltransferase